MRSPNFVMAFLLAPFAGAVTAVVLAGAVLLATEEIEPALTRLGSLSFLVGVSALVVCALFTAVAGGLAAGYVYWRRRVPSLPWALVIGFVLGAGSFVLLGYVYGTAPATDPDALVFSAYAGACSLPTAWAFWGLGLRGRTVPERATT